MQVAQAALAVLDVGLDAIARLARAPVALVALGQLGLHELARGALHHLAPEAPHEVGKQALVAEDQARIEERRADRDVGAGKLERLLDGAGGVAHLQPQVPQQIEHVLHHALAPGRLLVGQQEQQIDVGEGREQAPAVAAGGDDGHALRIGGVGGRIDVGGGVVVDEPDQLVLEGREAFRAAPAVAVGLDLPGGLGAGRLEQCLEALEDRCARVVATVGGNQCCQLAADLSGVEIGGLGCDAGVHWASRAACGPSSTDAGAGQG